MPVDLLRQRLNAVRRRWRALVALRTATVAAADAVAIIFAGLVGWWALRPQGLRLVAVVGVTLLLATVAVARRLRRAHRAVADRQIARLIEERCPELEDGLATAVAHQVPAEADSPLRAWMLRDVAERLRAVDPARVIPRRALRTAGIGAAATCVALVGVLVPFARPARQAATITGLYLFPAHMALEVTPGSVRLRAGERLTIAARLPGGATGLVPVLETARGTRRHTERMAADRRGGFAVAIPNLDESFVYRVQAGGVRSGEYRVTVLRPPRVVRIDVHYDYPPSFGLAPHVEQDGGDIFGPVGTWVRLVVHPDKRVRAAALAMADGRTVPLAEVAGGVLEGRFTIDRDGSYRVALGDADGLRNPGDTEYFIRTLEDRPPDVRVLKPAGDREVSPVEEVAIQARADDDYGIAAFDLVYSVRGGPEKVIPFGGTPAGTTVSGDRTLYLETLGVQPGDFVTYYARARDVARGRRSSEARSDIFFLDVKPFDEEFVSAPSQAGQGGGPADDLARAQKEIIVATWKLDRRSRPASGTSEQDVRTVARAQGELRARAQQAASQMSAVAAQQRRRRARGAAGAGEPGDGALIARAVEAMGRAQAELERLSTLGALPHEMTALNELLKAQAEIRRRQVQQQQAQGAGRFQNREQQDLSTLFDRELRRQQATNYENPNSSETRQDTDRSEALDTLRELARRQGDLNDQQRALAQQQRGLDPGELRRRLDRLTRDQNELRREAEQLAQQLGKQPSPGERGESGARSGAGSQGSRGSQGSSSASQGSSGSSSGSAAGQGAASRSARDASEEMASAAGDLRRQDPQQASARGARALEKLRDIEQQLRAGSPDERRRALGDLQMESRQLADDQRQLAREARQSAGPASAGGDRERRLGAAQARLADRADRLRDGLQQLAGQGGRTGADRHARASGARSGAQGDALRQAARQIEGARDGMREAARRLGQPGTKGGGDKPDDAATTGQALEQLARSLDKAADQVAAASGDSGEARRLSDQLARARDLQDRLAQLDGQLGQMAHGATPKPSPSADSPQAAQDGPPGTRGTGGSAEAAGTNGPGDVQRREAETAQRLRETRDLIDRMRRDHPELERAVRNGEGLHPGLSAPGTEAFKQDYAKWESLKKNLSAALEQVETSLSTKLRDRAKRDRLNAGGSDAVPDEYRAEVDRYYKALAETKKEKEQRR